MVFGVSKLALRDELVRVLRADLTTLERAQAATREAATHEEAKPENDKDTRALEQSYLARGQALRVAELQVGLAAVEAMALTELPDTAPVTLGAIVTCEEDEAHRTWFLASHGGGTPLAEGRVQVVTPLSPLGRALLGKRVGDAFDVRIGDRVRELALVAVG